MNMFDILVSIKGKLEWVTEVYADDLNRAITDAIQLVGKAEYVGHKHYSVVGGQWVETIGD
jgi:hypothetical protein